MLWYIPTPYIYRRTISTQWKRSNWSRMISMSKVVSKTRTLQLVYREELFIPLPFSDARSEDGLMASSFLSVYYLFFSKCLICCSLNFSIQFREHNGSKVIVPEFLGTISFFLFLGRLPKLTQQLVHIFFKKFSMRC